MKESFVITRLSREDLKTLGYVDVDKIPDTTMERIANKMADSYVGNSFWIDLEFFADEFGLKQE